MAIACSCAILTDTRLKEACHSGQIHIPPEAETERQQMLAVGKQVNALKRQVIAEKRGPEAAREQKLCCRCGSIEDAFVIVKAKASPQTCPAPADAETPGAGQAEGRSARDLHLASLRR